MEKTFGNTLGAILAQLEEDLRLRPSDAEVLEKMHRISDMYRNFCAGDYPGFQLDFNNGYALGKSGVIMDRETGAENLARVYGHEPTQG